MAFEHQVRSLDKRVADLTSTIQKKAVTKRRA